MYSKLPLTSLLFCTAFFATASAEMIYHSAERSIMGLGSQLDYNALSTDSLSAYSDDLISSGYVRDENRAIVGSVSTFASQSSTLSGRQIRGIGRGSAFGSGPGQATGTSRMEVEFSVSEPTQFTLSGQLRLAQALELNNSLAFIRLTGPNGAMLEVVMDENNLPDSLGRVNFSGKEQISAVFPAGNYLLEAVSEGVGSDGLTRCADFEFTLTAVSIPEPLSKTSLLMGMLGLAMIRRRKLRR